MDERTQNIDNSNEDSDDVEGNMKQQKNSTRLLITRKDHQRTKG